MSGSDDCRPSEFEKIAKDWLAAFPAAEQSQRSSFYYTFKNALTSIGYFEVLQGKVTINDIPMLIVYGSFTANTELHETVMADLEKVWNEYIVAGGRAMHSFEPNDSGFDMHFAVTPSNNYVINGVLKVSAKGSGTRTTT